MFVNSGHLEKTTVIFHYFQIKKCLEMCCEAEMMSADQLLSLLKEKVIKIKIHLVKSLTENSLG